VWLPPAPVPVASTVAVQSQLTGATALSMDSTANTDYITQSLQGTTSTIIEVTRTVDVTGQSSSTQSTTATEPRVTTTSSAVPTSTSGMQFHPSFDFLIRIPGGIFDVFLNVWGVLRHYKILPNYKILFHQAVLTPRT
jgi:hypothetical protein